MKHILICGLGSIGRRHLRHFRALGVERIDAFRTGLASLPDDGQPAPDKVFGDLATALAERPKAVIVANPTALHLPAALAAVRAGADVLIEKPVSHSLDGIAELSEVAERLGRIVAVAHNLRYHAGLRQIRHWVRTDRVLGRALTARIHFGAYLPDWHPWEDYRKSYAARRGLGGGAALTHVHEIDYALWIFGVARRAAVLTCGLQPLSTDVDEAASFLISHESGTLSTITLSLFERPTKRECEVVFESARVRLDLLTGRVLIERPDGAESRVPDTPFDFDSTYRLQAEEFLEALANRSRPATTLGEGAAAVRVALLAQGDEHE